MKGTKTKKAIVFIAIILTFGSCQEEPIFENEKERSIGGGGYDPDNRESNDAEENAFRD